MTVAFDAVASNSVVASVGTTLTWTHTPVGTPTAVGVTLQNYDPFATIVGITYGGVSMVRAITNTTEPFSVQIWGLANPPAGAQTVTITFSGTGAYCQAGSVTVTGSSTTTCFRNSNSNAGADTSGATTVSVTSVAGDLIYDVIGLATVYTLTPGGSQVQRWNLTSATDAGASSTLSATGSSTTMTWAYASGGITTNWAVAAASFEVSTTTVTDDGVATRGGAMQAIILMRERASGLLEPIREIIRPRRPAWVM